MTEAEGFVALFEARRRAEPDRLFARFEGEPISFASLARRADAFANALRRLGVARGDRVAVMLRNSPSAPRVRLAAGGLTSLMRPTTDIAVAG